MNFLKGFTDKGREEREAGQRSAWLEFFDKNDDSSRQVKIKGMRRDDLSKALRAVLLFGKMESKRKALDTVEDLLKGGADPNFQANGKTLLEEALAKGVDPIFISSLINYGGDPRMKGKKALGPLLAALMTQNAEVCLEMLAEKAALSGLNGEEEASLALTACSLGNEAAVWFWVKRTENLWELSPDMRRNFHQSEGYKLLKIETARQRENLKSYSESSAKERLEKAVDLLLEWFGEQEQSMARQTQLKPRREWLERVASRRGLLPYEKKELAARGLGMARPASGSVQTQEPESAPAPFAPLSPVRASMPNPNARWAKEFMEEAPIKGYPSAPSASAPARPGASQGAPGAKGHPNPNNPDNPNNQNVSGNSGKPCAPNPSVLKEEPSAPPNGPDQGQTEAPDTWRVDKSQD